MEQVERKNSAFERLNDMIKVIYKGRLGNNLFQYALGRILAVKMGYKLEAEPIPGFPKTAEVVDGKICAGKPYHITDQIVDIDGALEKHSGNRIVLDGYFQKYEYYKHYKNEIRKWFATDGKHCFPYQVGEDDIVVNIRCGMDYKAAGYYFPYPYLRITPFCWYEKILNRTKWNNLYVVTDDEKGSLPQLFKAKYGAKILHAGPMDDIMIRGYGLM